MSTSNQPVWLDNMNFYEIIPSYSATAKKVCCISTVGMGFIYCDKIIAIQ